jgi:hypothetical protein
MSFIVRQITWKEIGLIHGEKLFSATHQHCSAHMAKSNAARQSAVAVLRML